MWVTMDGLDKRGRLGRIDTDPMQKRSRSKEQLDFEIVFYERLLAETPGFIDAMRALGEAYSRRGWYEKGLRMDEQLTRLRMEDPVVWYNLACSYSLLNRPDEAIDALRKAIGLGYDDFAYLLKDPDLSTAHRSPKLRQLLAERLAHKPS